MTQQHEKDRRAANAAHHAATLTEDVGSAPAGVLGSFSGEGNTDPGIAEQLAEEISPTERMVRQVDAWPLPKPGAYALKFNREILRMPGFYDPPDIYGQVRGPRVAEEYPEIHVWADRIADKWYGRAFTDLRSPARRQRIIAAMMFVGHKNGNPRIAGIPVYLQALRKEAEARALEVLDTVLSSLGLAVAAASSGVDAKSTAGKVLRAVGAGTSASKVIGDLARAVEERGVTDPELLQLVAQLKAELLDVLDAVGDLGADTSKVKSVLGRLDDVAGKAQALLASLE